MDKVIKKRLQDMAQDFRGPAGPIPFERLIVRHLVFFTDLRNRGSTWEQIAGLLAEADIRPGDKRRFPAAHLRGVVSRQTRRAELQARADARQDGHGLAASQRSQSSSTAPPARSKNEMHPAPVRPAAATAPKVKAKAERRPSSADQASVVRISAARVQKSTTTDSDVKSIRAFMDRAAQLRRTKG
jgi:hypothetical protein